MHSPLEFLIRHPKVSIEKPPLLILLHGVGSNEKDLFSLTEFLPDSLLIVSVRGPIILGRDRFGWYEIKFTGGAPKIDAEQQQKSQKILLEFLNFLSTQFQFDTKQVWFGGFSQGAVMSYSIGLEHPDRVKGIIALSGRILEETKKNTKTDDVPHDQKIYIAHGTNDNVIPVTSARASKEFLESRRIEFQYKEYPDGHTISNEMLGDLVAWLDLELKKN